MEIRHLQYFKQVCEDKSFSKAAENLFITQQGISRAIQTLEKDLGITFFVRGKNGVTLTEMGVNVVPDVENLLDSFNKFQEKMQSLSQAASGIVKISLTLGAMSYLVPRLLEEFDTKYPNIELQLAEKPDTLCEELVSNGKVDIACTTGPIENELLEWIPLFQDSVMVMMRRDNPLSQKEYLVFEDLKSEKFVLPSKEFKWHNIIIERCNEVGFNPNISYSIGDLSVTFNIIKQNGGVGFLNKNLSASFDDKENTFVLLLPDKKLKWHMGLLKKKGVSVTYATQAVINYIVDIAREQTTFLDLPLKSGQ